MEEKENTTVETENQTAGEPSGNASGGQRTDGVEGAKDRLPVKKHAFPDLPTKTRQELLPYESENYSTLEKAIIDLGEELANITELKDAIEHSFTSKSASDDKFQGEVTSYFNSLRKQFDEFNERFTREIDYTREMELKIQNNEYRGQIYLLEKELSEERAKITIALDEISKTVKETMQTVSEKCMELKAADRLIEEAILKFRTDSTLASENEYKALKQQCETSLKLFTENAQKTLEAVKKNSIEFLAQCEKENKSLIGKVPEVKGKLTTESWIVIVFACVGIASLILNLVL